MFQHLYHVEVLEFTSVAAWATISLKKHLPKLLGIMEWNPIFKENEHYL